MQVLQPYQLGVRPMQIEITGISETDALHTMFYHLRMAAACFENCPKHIDTPENVDALWQPAFDAFLEALETAYDDAA